MQQSVLSVTAALIKSLIKFINKANSRKFIAWVVATHMTYVLLLDPQSWLFVTMLWMGIDGALAWKGMPSAVIAAATDSRQDSTVSQLSTEPTPTQPGTSDTRIG